MERVMAQGTFDIIHPGHLHYFRESAALGDELVVVIARDERVAERKDLFFDHHDRVALVDSLAIVDEVQLGTTDDPFDILNEVEPDAITIGHDQPYDVDELSEMLAERGHDDVVITRISEYEAGADEIVSSSLIKELVKEHYGADLLDE